MKLKLFLIIILSVLILAIAFSTAWAGSLSGWTVMGDVQHATDCTALQDCDVAQGFGTGGSIQQSVSIPNGKYNLVVYCKGTPSISLTDGADTVLGACNTPNGTTGWSWSNSLLLQLPVGTATVNIQLAAGDEVDWVCFYPIDSNGNGGCPPSLVKNYSFIVDLPAPTPTCTPKGHGNKCK